MLLFTQRKKVAGANVNEKLNLGELVSRVSQVVINLKERKVQSVSLKSYVSMPG